MFGLGMLRLLYNVNTNMDILALGSWKASDDLRVGRAEARWQQAEDMEDSNMNPSRELAWAERTGKIDGWEPREGYVNPGHQVEVTEARYIQSGCWE